MKKLLAFLLLSPLLGFCQNQESLKGKRFSAELIVSPSYSYRNLVPFDTSIYHKQAVDSLNTIEKGKLAFTFGINLSYKITHHFALNLGFNISDKGFQSKGFGWNNSIWDGYAIFKQEDYKENKIYFYEIPLSFRYLMNLGREKKIQMGFTLGATYCQNITKYEYISRRFWIGGPSYDINDESTFIRLYAESGSISYLGYMAGLTLQIPFTKKINLDIDPIFKYYLFHFYKAHDSNEAFIGWTGVIDKPYSIGCNIGLNYTF